MSRKKFGGRIVLEWSCAWELHEHAHGALGGGNLEFLCEQTRERGTPLAWASIKVHF